MFSQKTFVLTDEEYNTIKTWANTHECAIKYGNRPSKSCCGGEISVKFTPTSFGVSVSACCACGKTLDLDTL